VEKKRASARCKNGRGGEEEGRGELITRRNSAKWGAVTLAFPRTSSSPACTRGAKNFGRYRPAAREPDSGETEDLGIAGDADSGGDCITRARL
jgi:hypothetical protein